MVIIAVSKTAVESSNLSGPAKTKRYTINGKEYFEGIVEFKDGPVKVVITKSIK